MDLSYFFRGCIIGLSIAAPVGPIGILCIRRTLAESRASGFVSGLGAATADALYGSIAGFGLTFVSSLLIREQGTLRLVGGLFLGYLGIKTFLSPPAKEEPSLRAKGMLSAYTSTLLLTVTNPMTILSFAAIFAGLGMGGEQRDYLSAGSLVLGVFIGSASWWLILSAVVGHLGRNLRSMGLHWVNRISGIIILSFAALAFLGLKR